MTPASIIWSRRWLIAVATILCAAAAYFFDARSPKSFRADALVQIIPSGEQSGSYVDPTTLDDLTNIYLQLASSAPSLREAVALAHIALTPAALRSHITVSDIEPGVLQFAAGASTASEAATYANAAVSGFVAHASQQSAAAEKSRLATLRSQITAVQTQLSLLPAHSRLIAPLQASLTSAQADVATIVSTPGDEAQPISPAATPASPSSPRPARTAALAAIFALLFFPGLSYAWALYRGRYGSGEEASADLQLPLLAIITRETPFSHHQREAGRALRASIEVAKAADGPVREVPVVLITSPGPATGKTFTAQLLTLTAATDGRDTTVIDADLHRADLTKQLGVAPGPGLHEFLAGEATATEILTTGITADGAVRNAVVFAQAGEGSLASGELLASPRFNFLLQVAKARAHTILIDSPPLVAVSDALIVSRSVNAVVLVLSALKTQRTDARRALAALRSVGAPAIGIVFNEAPRQLLTSTRYDDAYYRHKSA